MTSLTTHTFASSSKTSLLEKGSSMIMSSTGVFRGELQIIMPQEAAPGLVVAGG